MCVKCDYKLKYKQGNKFTSYIPLHGHSTYSQGDGVTKIEDIMTRAKEVGAKGISLTEHGNMSSFYKFYKHAMETGINPIIGCELYTNDLYHDKRLTNINTRTGNKFNQLGRNNRRTGRTGRTGKSIGNYIRYGNISIGIKFYNYISSPYNIAIRI